MSLNLEQKQAVVAEVAAVIAGAKAAVVAEYSGLTVAQMTGLRRKAHEADVYLKVVKNTLVRRAVIGSEFECLTDHVSGPLAFAVGKDPVAIAKVVSDFAKDNARFVVKVGAMGGRLVSREELEALAKLPAREVLLALLLGTMKAPVQKFVQTLNEIPARFVRTLAAVRDARAAL
ncbi:MAG: 50S ribosomal protein L10 [Acidiferrobacteraceae bacterium]|jgi:large subunit ribosomal protein L10